MSEVIWEFDTPHFRVLVTAEEEHDIDLSWDETGEIAEGIASGEFVIFCAKAAVYFRGLELSSDYLGNCIYKSLVDFKQCGYFSDMVRTVLTDARSEMLSIQSIPLRNAA